MEGRAMKQPSPAGLGLRLRIALQRLNAVTAGALALLALLAGGLLWIMLARTGLERERDAFQARAAQRAAAVARADAALDAAATAAAVPAPVALPATDNLAAFYGALGERRDAEQQLKTLFALAGKAGLVLRQGEYKSAWDRNAGMHTYQVNLPVKGSYDAIWRFAMDALRAIPFAALDDISFRRETIGDASVEARVRLTLYLRDGAAGGPQ
jgi:hypothetical protein